MDEKEKNVDRLLTKLNLLLERQEALQEEIRHIKKEVSELSSVKTDEIYTERSVNAASGKADSEKARKRAILESQLNEKKRSEHPGFLDKFRKEAARVNLEAFIGGNLINKIGIVIIILGVGIGTKLAIDYDLISPLVRVVLGYLLGFLLFGSSRFLKNTLTNFSAVLLSGSMAVLYFITYAAHAYYEVLSGPGAFILMVILIVYTVYSALEYNKEIISVIGLVGAYGIPFFITTDTENYNLLFSYITMINLGILIVSIKKYWKILFYLAFSVSWLILGTWYFFEYNPETGFWTGFIFNLIFFLIFYASILIRNQVVKHEFRWEDSTFLILNALLFFGFGYGLMEQNSNAATYQGLFTFVNGVIHFSLIMSWGRGRKDEKLVNYPINALVIFFITLSIPVQLSGNWVTLLWFTESLILFWLGRKRLEILFEYSAYLVIVLGVYSLINTWYQEIEIISDGGEQAAAFLNFTFITALVSAAIAFLINYMHFTVFYRNFPLKDDTLRDLVDSGLAAIFLFILFFAFRTEIAVYWKAIYQEYVNENVSVQPGGALYQAYDLMHFKTVTINIYSILFFIIISLISVFKLKDKRVGSGMLIMNSLVILVFLVSCLYALSQLRESFILGMEQEGGQISAWYVGIRYIALLPLLVLMGITYLHSIQPSIRTRERTVLIDLFLSLGLIWLVSSELIHWLDLTGITETYKIYLSILWGTCALVLVSIGMWRRKKHLRIAAIVLFGITLLKLFIYDLTDLNTISKTIAFIMLGVFLLIISFLYNKYSKFIFEDIDPNDK